MPSAGPLLVPVARWCATGSVYLCNLPTGQVELMNLRANTVASHGWRSSGSNPHRSVSMVGPPGAGTQVHKQPEGISARESTVTGRSNPRTDSGGLLREFSCL